MAYCSHYNLLGIECSASFEEIRTAFKQCALATHPDKGGSKEAFQQVAFAFETLADVDRRRKYDSWLSWQGGTDAQVTARSAPDIPAAKTSSHSAKKAPSAKPMAQRNMGSVDALAGRSRRERCIWRLFQLLQELEPQVRLVVIRENFTESMRREFESFIVTHKYNASRVSAEKSAGSESSSMSDDSSEESDEAITDLHEDASGSGACLALCDHWQQGENSRGTRNAVQTQQGGNRTQGLLWRHKGVGTGWYFANIRIGSLELTTRWVRELDVALDHLLVLTTMKRQARHTTRQEFADSLREILPRALADQDCSMSDLGLGFRVAIAKGFWVGRTWLCTPIVHDLEAALRALEALSPFQGASGLKGFDLIVRRGWSELLAEWHAFRECYIGICVAGGQSREQVRARLAALEEARRPCREAQLERWNRRRMEFEDCVILRERRRHAASEQRILHRVRAELDKWRRQQKRVQKAQLRHRARQRAVELRRKLRDEDRKRKASREARWRAVKRSDLTMDDILGQRLKSAASSSR
eukprot:TRINITY_DN38238_c0_g1_i1.p1 TRINITY_DN38238_c0_g1~~TRINITY_DN38238_c0_g1_i1.p1  ORF type:complete len:544 (-),score=68.88 TRINITY_DN38238_c0_g1_i1:192-1781(-)